MKKISLKLKLTLLYTFFMVLLTCAALAILFSLSSREMLSSTQTRLENRVQESVEFIALRNGEIRIDSDFYSVVRDVYLSLYDSDMYFMYGRIPHGFTQQPELADGEIGRYVMETENGMCMTCHTGCPRIGLFMFGGSLLLRMQKRVLQ